MTSSEHVSRSRFDQFFYELREGARRQGNIIFALIFRELKTKSTGGGDGFGWISLVGAFFEPAVYVGMMAFFWTLLGRTVIGGVPVILFLTVSIIGFTVFRRGFAVVPRSIKSNKGFYSFPKVKPFDAVLAKFLMELLLTIIGGCVLLFLIWWFMDLHIRMDRFLEGMGIFGILCMASFGLSLFIGVYGALFPVINRIISMGSRMVMFLSAVIHPASTLPPFAQYYMSWNPIAHAMELLRYYFLDMPPFDHVSLQYFVGFGIVSLFMGFIAYHANRFKVLES